MNHLGNLHYAPGSRKKVKRVGRGQGSGKGGTSTRGHKGAQSRAGAKRKVGFEGGQMPLHRRLPKFGFTPPNREIILPVNVARLEELALNGRIQDGVVTPDVLHDLGVIARKRSKVKILGDGELTSKLTVSAHAFSESAKSKIESAGGVVHVLPTT